MPFIFTHYLLLIFIIWCLLFVYISFVFLHGCWVPFIETHFVFVFTPSLPPYPPFSPTHQQAASQSKAQKKLQPLTQVPVLQEQGEYCAGVGGVWTWVPAVWSSEGEGGAVFFPFLSPSCFSSVSQLSSFCSPPGMVCVIAPLSSLSHCPREIPHTQCQHQAGNVGFSLVCLCICLRAPEECLAVCAASCVCVCAQILDCINTQAF